MESIAGWSFTVQRQAHWPVQGAHARLDNRAVEYGDWGGPGRTGTFTDGYDANGSVTKKTTWDTQGTAYQNDDIKLETVTYEYNLQNRLARVEKVVTGSTTVQITEYKYNPQGIRVEKHTWTEINDIPQPGEVYTGYLIDAYNHTGYAQVFKETFDDGSITTTSYIIGDDVLAQAIDSADPQYLLYDGHGSTRQLSDSTGSLITNESYSYDAYGVLLGGPRTTQTDLLYAGQMYDSVTDAYYLRARYYSPSTGRFNRMDPFAGNNLDPQSLHKYLYAHGNPVNGNDPSGSFFIGGHLAVFAISQIMCSQVQAPLVEGSQEESKIKFDAWYQKQQLGDWWSGVLPPCPCKITVKDGKPSYTGRDKKEWDPPETPHPCEERLHPKIKFSMRSKVKQRHTNQCTYNEEGKLYTKHPQAGTVDWRAARTPAHLGADVYPLHWAVHVDTGKRMRVTGGPKTPQWIPSYKYMKMYFDKRPLWDWRRCPSVGLKEL